MISPAQFRMARAASSQSLRDMAIRLGKSVNALSRFERGDTSVISQKTILEAKLIFEGFGLFFGPADGVCIKQNVFDQERMLQQAFYRLLNDHGVYPSSSDILSAYKRVNKERT